MTNGPKDPGAVVRDLERIRAEVRERALHEPATTSLPPPPQTRAPEAAAPLPPTPPVTPPRHPDATALNEMWRAEPPEDRPGLLRRLFNRLLRPSREAQVAWNARQVQLDNEILEYIDSRFHATHTHYDSVLGIHGKRMQEIDERHLILQEELVSHVHDLVRRIDLVLSQAERENLGLEVTLRAVRRRVEALENARRP